MARDDRRTVVKSRERARSSAYTRKTMQASKDKPVTQTGGAGKGGGKGPPKTPAAVSDSSKGKSVSRRTGVATTSAKRGERLVGSGTAANKALPAAKVAAKKLTAAGALGRLSVVAAGTSEIKRTIDQKNDPARPTVQEHAAKSKARRAKMKQHDFSKSKGDLNKVNLGTSGMVNSAQKNVNSFDATKAGTGVKRPKSTAKPAAKSTAKPAAKAKTSAKKGGYSYTGPKVGSDEYKAMRKKKYEKRKAAAFAKTKTGKARSAAKSRTSAKQQGTTPANYQQPVMSRRNGNEHRQNTYTGDSATTSANLAKSTETPTSGGGEEKNFWGKHGPRLAKTWNEMKGY